MKIYLILLFLSNSLVALERTQTLSYSHSHTNYSVPQVKTLQLAQLSKIYEGKIPVSLLLAHESSLSAQPAIAYNSDLPLQRNATMVLRSNTDHTHIPSPLAVPQYTSQYTTDQLSRLNYNNPTQPGRPCHGARYVAQREGVLENALAPLSHHIYGNQIFNARKATVIEELNQTITTLRAAIVKPESNETTAASTQALIKLNSLTTSVPDLNTKLTNVIESIQKQTCAQANSSASLCLSPRSYNAGLQKSLEADVAKFAKEVKNWVNNQREFDIVCADQADRYIRRNRELLECGLDESRLYNLESWKFLHPEVRPANPPQFQKITNHPFYKTFNNVEILLKRGNFDEARNLCATVPKGGDYNRIQAVYKEHFYAQYTSEGIEKRYINNPYYLAQKDTLYASCQDFPLPHELNSFLEQTQNIYEKNIQALGITKTNPLIDHIVYKLAEVPSGVQSVSSFISSYDLSSNSPDPLKREAFQQLYQPSGLQKIFQISDQHFKNIPAAIGTIEHIKERQLLNAIAACKISTQQDAKLFSHTIDYVTLGLQNSPESKHYLTLAHATANALLDPQSNRLMRQLSNYATPSDNRHHQQIQKAAVGAIAEKLNFIQNADPKNPSVAQSVDIIRKIDNAYYELQEGDLRAEFYLEKALTPSVNTEILKVDYDAHMAYYAGINQDQVIAHVQPSKDATLVLLKNGAEIELNQYQLPTAIQEHLISLGYNPKDYEKCYGHQVQRAIHLDILRQVVKQKDLSGLALINTSGLYKLRDLSSKVTDLSRQHNVLGNIEQAGMLSSFCWQIMHHVETAGKYGIDTVKGFGEGVIQGGQSFAHTVTHPQEVIQGFKNLGKTVARIVEARGYLNDISILKPHAENLKLEAQFYQACEQSGLPALGKHAMHKIQNNTWRENVRDGTAIIIENRLMGKTVNTAGTLVEATGIKTVALAGRLANKLKVPVTSVATAEGIEIKVAQAAKNCALSEAPQATKGGLQSVTQAVTTGEFTQFSAHAIEEGVKYATSPTKIRHIFQNFGHNLNQLVEQLGGRESTVRAILNEASGKLPASGLFEDVVVKVGGYDVYIRGVVIDGVPKLGTFYIK